MLSLTLIGFSWCQKAALSTKEGAPKWMITSRQQAILSLNCVTQQTPWLKWHPNISHQPKRTELEYHTCTKPTKRNYLIESVQKSKKWLICKSKIKNQKRKQVGADNSLSWQSVTWKACSWTHLAWSPESSSQSLWPARLAHCIGNSVNHKACSSFRSSSQEYFLSLWLNWVYQPFPLY